MNIAVECSICLSIFKEPTSLPCGHIYCTKCLSDYVNSANNRTMASSCPTCRAGFSIVTPELTYLPKKYHQYIVPALRRLYLDVSQYTILHEKLQQAEEINTLYRNNEQELRRSLDQLKAAMVVSDTGVAAAARKLVVLEADLAGMERDCQRKLDYCGARIGEMEAGVRLWREECGRLEVCLRREEARVAVYKAREEAGKRRATSTVFKFSAASLIVAGLFWLILLGLCLQAHAYLRSALDGGLALPVWQRILTIAKIRDVVYRRGRPEPVAP
ncbi:hypothetical protein B0H34DRAFT_400570 [Crassisporium funariophilum]|nr:hypothetical protein B0H34DRAFT_400570 [Crassisporium funariophilum]